MKEFGVEGNVSYIVTDNASNMKKAFETSLVEEDQDEDEDIELEEEADDSLNLLPVERIACFSHSLQLVVKDGLKDKRAYSQAIARCSRMCTLLHSSQSFKVPYLVMCLL